MKSQFHINSFYNFFGRLSMLILLVLSIQFCVFTYFKDYFGSLYHFIGFIFMLTFRVFIFKKIKKNEEFLPFFLILSMVYFCFPILAYFKYSYSTIFWMFLIPIGMSLFYDLKKVFIVCIFLTLLTFISIYFHKNFFYNYTFNYSYLQTIYGDFVSILCLIVFFIYFIIEHLILHRNYLDYLEKQKNEISELRIKRQIFQQNIDYQNLINFINEKKLYKNKDYTIQNLSKDYGKSYFEISKILKSQKTKNFKFFINTIRIHNLTLRISKGDLKIFTLQSLYQENGFEHQSTFNRVFKEIMGETPSDFIKKNAPKD